MSLRKTAVISLVFLSCGEREEELAVNDNVEAVTSLPYYDQPNFTPIWNPKNPDTLHSVDRFTFVNQLGEATSNETVKGKIFLVNFFFSSCAGICPKMMRNMQRVHEKFSANEEVILISHTVMPWLDSLEVLKKYSERFNPVNGRWHFVTGDKAELYRIARQSYFVEEEPGFTKDSTEFLHTEHFVLVDRGGHLRGLYNGTLDLEVERICEDIELLLAE